MGKVFSKNQKLRNDIVLVAVIIIITVTGLMLINTLKKEGEYAVVKYYGEVVCGYPLDKDERILLSYEEGCENLLVIENGAVYVEKANCRDKICVDHKEIKNSGESIICLPHKLVIEITAQKINETVDVVV